MNDRERRQYERLVRVKNFGKENVTDFEANSRAARLFAELEKLLADIDANSSEQFSADSEKRQAAANKATLRAEILESLRIIRDITRAIAIENPDFSERFLIPGSLNDQGLLAIARAFLNDARPFLDEFVSYEMPADLLDDLAADIADFQAAIEQANKGLTDRGVAVEGIDKAMSRSMDLVSQLKPIVSNKYRKDPQKLSQWLDAIYVVRIPRTKKQE
jgi:hypothetical protein